MNRKKMFWLTTLIALAMSITLAHAGPGTLAPTVSLPAPYGTFGTYYANSPSGPWSYYNALGVATGSSNSGTPLRKFVDSLPGLGVAGANNLGNYIPVATKGTNPVAGDPADYYEIEVKDYNQQLHSDLPGPLNATNPGPGTKLRGYHDLNPAAATRPYYLGPLIIARSYDPTLPANTAGNGAPVRIKFVNNLGKSNGVSGAGDLFLPVDETAMGAGYGPLSYTVDPATGLVSKNAFNEKYRQNRAELHLHGGVTPWISDGTPHQWFTSVTDSDPATNSYARGASQVNVPDMPDPGPGAGTYYYSNQQSARLMFYHDHAFGMTRLNVYAGEAAGYLLTDQTEETMITNAVLPDNGGGLNRYGIPLIIQDKTFVPLDVAVQDNKWTNPLWGSYGDLWMSHVYEPNQNPNDLSGANPYGRWDYGPWFWPPVTIGANYVALPGTGTSNVSNTPESFNDTPIVNGAAYPFLTVEPKAYRFRILNAANDRPFNLQLYISDPASPDNAALVNPTAVSTGFPTEVAMLPAAKWPVCTLLKNPLAATPLAPLNCSCTAAYAPLGCTPATWPTDGRDGGAPDPQFVGPSMIQIGTEGGLLPSPVVINNQPVNYDYNRRNIVVLDILYKSLLLAPAERADVLIDFTNYSGKTIIMYNDAPAPMPAFDARFDYFTNAMDQTSNGGAPSTLPGFGPNTRTVMQFRVGTATTGTALNYKNANNTDTALMGTLKTAISAAFAATQPKPIVPESAYKVNYPADTSPNLVPGADVYSTIFNTSLTFTPIGAVAGTLPITVPFISKAIQELWDPYGRMNATLGVELPLTNVRNQTTIPYGYIDPPTEIMNADGSPILWKITHNGVDTHPVHFHLYDVQLINRVGWDGAIRPPDANELGWKETVRMKPLEDVVVAFRPQLPKLPFGLPRSHRLLDPSMPEGAISTVDAAGTPTGLGPVFMNINPDGTPSVQANVMTYFDHEYVWHCHILGHEENDFMRAQIITDTSVLPIAPVLTETLFSATQINLYWTDGTPASAPATLGNPQNEIGFHIYRCTGVGCSINVATTTNLINNALANQTTFADTTVTSGNSYTYQVAAYNAAGQSLSNQVNQAILNAVAPSRITVPASSTTGSYSVSWTASSTPSPVYILQESIDPGFGTFTQTVGATSPMVYTGKANGTYYYRVMVQAAGYLNSAWVTGVNGCVVLLPPTLLTPSGTVGTTTPTYTFNAVAGATSYSVRVVYAGVASDTAWITPNAAGCPGNVGVCSIPQLTPLVNGRGYGWYARAQNPSLIGSFSTVMSFTVVITAAAPASITVPATSATGNYTVSWAASTTTGATYVLQESTTANFNTFTVVTSGLTGTSAVISGKTNGTYYYRVKAQASGITDSAWVSGSCVVSIPLPAAPILSTPSGSATTTPTYTFSAVAGATGYSVRTVYAGVGSNTAWITPTTAGCPGNVGVCSIPQLTPLISGGGYGWYARAQNSSGTGPFSTVMSFTAH